MTQQELREKIHDAIFYPVSPSPDDIIEIINQHVAEVIGEDERHDIIEYKNSRIRNSLRDKQRKRAGL